MPFKRNNPGCCCNEYVSCQDCHYVPERILLTYELRFYTGATCTTAVDHSQYMQAVLTRVEGVTITGAATPGYWVGGCTTPFNVTAAYAFYSAAFPYIDTQYWRFVVYCRGLDTTPNQPGLLIGIKKYSTGGTGSAGCLADGRGVNPPYDVTYPGTQFSANYQATRTRSACKPFHQTWEYWNIGGCSYSQGIYTEQVELIEI